MTDFAPCPFCQSDVDWCCEMSDPDGCHDILCSGCGANIDFAHALDPEMVMDDLSLRRAIAERFNRQAGR